MKNKALETRERIQNFDWDNTIEDITDMLTAHMETSRNIASDLSNVTNRLIEIDARITTMIAKAENALKDELRALQNKIDDKQIEYDNSDGCFKSKDKGLLRAKQAMERFKNEMELDMGAKLKKLPGLSRVVNTLKKKGLDKKELIEDFESEMGKKL